MASDVDIANEALALVAGPGGGFTSFADQSREAQLCQRFYETSRDAVLEAANWWFAIKTATLSAPTTGDTYDNLVESGDTYALPSDCLRPIELMPADEVTTDWVCTAGRLLVTAQPSPILRYVAKIDDPSQFTPTFIKALAAYMAWQLAYPVTESRAKAADMYEHYKEMVKEARTVSGSVGRQARWMSNRATQIRARRS